VTTPPRYPIYVPSKDRSDTAFTVGCLQRDGTPFRLVVEPAQEDEYRKAWPEADLLVTPHDDMKLLGVRNWVRDHAEAEGHARHWQIDDNVRHFFRMYRGERLRINSSIALRICEDFTDRYTNIGLSGLNYEMFVTMDVTKPFYLNCHVYSITLINHAMPYRWRLVYNDDTDLCLQALAGGWCTVALNVVNAQKIRTMRVKGGNTDELYQDDGSLKMARALERQWPHVVETYRRYGRAQHRIKGSWRHFNTPLIRRTDIDWANLPTVDEYGMQLEVVDPEVGIRSPVVERLYEANRSSG
jgi:hypothetical protein